MNKRVFALLLFFVLMAVLWFAIGQRYLFPGHHKALAPAKPPNAALTLKEASAAPIPQADLPQALPARKAAIDPLRQDCQSQGQLAAGLAMPDLQEELRKGRFTLNPKCAKVDGLPENVADIYRACDFDRQRVALADEKKCLGMIALYRAYWIAILSESQSDLRAGSLALLANRLIGTFIMGITDPSKRPQVVALAEAFIDRDPRFIEAHKALVVAKMGAMDQPDFDRGKFADDIAQGLALDPHDPQLLKAYLLNEQLAGHPDAVDAFIEQNPDAGVGYYFRAQRAYKSHDLNSTRADLQAAAQLSPDDREIAEALGKIRSGQTTDLFNINIRFELNGL